MKEAQAMATKRQSRLQREKLKERLPSVNLMNIEKEKHKQRSNVVLKRSLLPATSCKLLKPSLQLPKKGQITRVCCNRLMYRKFVIEFKITKYSNAPDDLTVAIPDSKIKQWICKTCDNALKRGKLPAQAMSNNLDLEVVIPNIGWIR